MSVQLLIYPMFALFLLTMIIMVLMLHFRIRAVRTRKVSPRYFKLNKGGDIPDHLVAISQNYNNLLELPILFYVICLVAIVMNVEIESFGIYAWLFVAFRYMHSLIHITYNHILHRLGIFAVSCIILILMWVKVLMFVSSTT